MIVFLSFNTTNEFLVLFDKFFNYLTKLSKVHSSFEVTMNTYANLMPEVYEKVS